MRVATLVAVPVAISVVVARAWTIFGDHPPVAARLVPVFALGVFAAGLFLIQTRPRARFGALALYWIFIGLTLIGLARAAHIGTYQAWGPAITQGATILLVGMIGTFGVAAATERRAATVLHAVCWAPIIYVSLNVVIHLTGFSPPVLSPERSAPAEILGLLGLPSDRVRFAMASGINNFGVAAGAAAAAAFVLTLRGRGWERGAAMTGFLLCGYALLLTDSRGAIITALGAAMLVLVIPRGLKRGMISLPFLLPLAPAALLLALGALANTPFGGAITRPGTDPGSGSGRSFVWGEVTDFLIREPSTGQLTGYGVWGHVQSGVSSRYADVLAGYNAPELGTAHNFLLQTVLDLGYVGVVVALALLVLALGNLLRAITANPNPIALSLAAMLLYFAVIGVSESAPSVYFEDSLIVWLLVVAAAVRSDLRTVLDREAPHRRIVSEPPPVSFVSSRSWEHPPTPALTRE
jgi:O-antigen ligase